MKKPTASSKTKADHATSKSPPDEALTADAAESKTDELNKEYEAPEDLEPHAPTPENNVFFEQGRTARRARIAKADAPHGGGQELAAWLAGYDYEERHVG